MWKERILLVDDDLNILSGYKRSLRKSFNIHTAAGGHEGIKKIEEGNPFSVVVSDMRMPSMDGIEFLKHVKKLSEDTVRVMLTGNADQQTAIDAVNKGNIFRFLSKPCSPELLSATLIASIRQYKLITAEKELLENTLQGSIDILIEILSLIDPIAFRRSTRLKAYVKHVAPLLGIDNIWEIEAAAMLSPIGYITLPQELRKKIESGTSLSTEEASMLAEVPEIGSRLLSNIPRMDPVAQMVQLCRNAAFQTHSKSETKIPGILSPGAQLINILADLIEQEESGLALNEAFEIMRRRIDRDDLVLLENVFCILIKSNGLLSGKTAIVDLFVKDLIVGDVLKMNAMTLDDRLLLSAETRLTGPFLERLKNYRKLAAGIKEPLRVKRQKK